MKKVLITIGIPAYNEAQNISNVLDSLVKQNKDMFNIKYIYVLSDGSTDNTNKIVKNFAKKYSFIKLLYTRKRKGKVFQLNRLYSLNTSDYLFNFDADIKIDDFNLINKTITLMKKQPKKSVVAIHQIPLRPTNFIGKCIYAGYEFWDLTRLSVNNSDHIQNLYGAATAYSKNFVKSFRFPNDITDDRGYLYICAKKSGGFIYNKKTNIFYHPVSTLHDFRKLADRSFNKNEGILKKYFGDEIKNYYHIPAKNKILSILKIFIREPIYCTGGLILNILTRVLPLHDKYYNSNMWEVSKSTKI